MPLLENLATLKLLKVVVFEFLCFVLITFFLLLVEAGLGPVTVIEFQYLKQDFGYSVYKEGYDVHVGYHIE